MTEAPSELRLFALRSERGHAAVDTVLCNRCFNTRNKAFAVLRASPCLADVDTWHDVTETQGCECIRCRARVDPPPTVPPDPTTVLKGYRWPASRLTKADMQMLCELKEQTHRPLTQLLHEAISAYYRVLTENPDSGEHCCPQPQLGWTGEWANAAIACQSCGFVLSDDGQLGDWHDPEQIVWEQEVAAESGQGVYEASSSSTKLGSKHSECV